MTENINVACDEFEALDRSRFETGPIGDIYNCADELVGLSGMVHDQSASDEQDSIWNDDELKSLAIAISAMCDILRPL